MPIIVSPPAEAPAVIPIPQPIPQRSPARWVWTGGGDTVVLSGEPDGQLSMGPGGVTGHLAAPVQVFWSEPTTMDGSMYLGERTLPRTLGVRFHAWGDTTDEWEALEQRLVRAFTSGDGTLTRHHVDGRSRSIACRYLSGLEASEDGDPGSRLHGRFSLLLRAPDPWWYGPTESMTFRPAVSRTFLGKSGDPFVFWLMPSPAMTNAMIVNPGDVEAFPEWVITGPCTRVVLTGPSALTLTHTLAAGEAMTVRTDPRVVADEKITGPSGKSLWGVASDDFPALWALPAGESPLSVAFTGTGTSVQMSFRPRYRTS